MYFDETVLFAGPLSNANVSARSPPTRTRNPDLARQRRSGRPFGASAWEKGFFLIA
jgi:hypothetical protein